MPEKYLKGRATVWPEEDDQQPQTAWPFVLSFDAMRENA